MHGVGFLDERSIVPKDMADLKFYECRLLPMHTALTGLENLLVGLERLFQRWCEHQESPPEVEHSWSEAVINYRCKADAHKTYLAILLQKCNSAASLLNGIVNFNSQSHTLFLTKATVDDSATVRVITFITLVFISFTVVAVSIPPFRHAEG